jgi:hypothetical protein
MLLEPIPHGPVVAYRQAVTTADDDCSPVQLSDLRTCHDPPRSEPSTGAGPYV